MEIRLETNHVSLPNSTGATLATRVHRVLSRLANGITRLHVTLKESKDSRGGRDKVCMLSAELADGRQVVVIDRSAKMRRAISGCLRRAKVLIKREIERRQAKRRQPTRGLREVALDARC